MIKILFLVKPDLSDCFQQISVMTGGTPVLPKMVKHPLGRTAVSAVLYLSIKSLNLGKTYYKKRT